MIAAVRKALAGKLIAVFFEDRLHEVTDQFEASRNDRIATGLMRCGDTYEVHTSQIVIAGPNRIDCPHCLLYRSELH